MSLPSGFFLHLHTPSSTFGISAQPTPHPCLSPRASEWSSTQDDWYQLHADYIQNEDYVFTSILYTDTERDPTLLGGETGLADELELIHAPGGLSSTRLKRGTLIDPKPGRLVIFTGGGENYHAPLRVRGPGATSRLHVWFKCK